VNINGMQSVNVQQQPVRFSGTGQALGGRRITPPAVGGRRVNRSRLVPSSPPSPGGNEGPVHDPGDFQVHSFRYVMADLNGTAVDAGRAYMLEELHHERRYHDAVNDYNEEHKIKISPSVYAAFPWLKQPSQ
jgi:hypothetical protein